MERFLAELMTINKEVLNWAQVQNPLFVPSFHKTSDVSIFFLKFVAVRSFTADSSLLQPTGVCEHYTLTRRI